ncbi:MAG: Lrp/AsnC ligand binding domain-containing protein, partial [Paracoccaceae bacterium]
PKNREKIEASLNKISQLTTLYSISGAFDMAAIISAHTIDKLDDLIDEIGCLEGIDATMSSIILSTKFDRE